MTNTKEEKQLLKIVMASFKLQELIHKSSYFQRDSDEDNFDPMLEALMNLHYHLDETVREYLSRNKRLVGS